MLMPILEDHAVGSVAGEMIVKAISTRLAGGRKEATTEPSQVCYNSSNLSDLSLTQGPGYRGYARVLLDVIIASSHFQTLGYPCHVDCRRLHTNTRSLR